MPAHAKSSAETHSATLLTKQELSQLFKVSTRHIERLVSTGRLPALKLSSKIIRFKRADVESFMDSAGSLFVFPEGTARP
jgi:excisionase family DNA binding protein